VADLTAEDVSYSIIRERITETQGRYENIVDITFGDGVKTVPADGLPLTPSLLGLPNGVIEVIIIFGTDSQSTFITLMPAIFNINKNTLFLQGNQMPVLSTFRLFIIGY
jgi:hypothetical protein